MLGARELNRVPTDADAEAQQIPADVHHHWKGNYGDCYTKLTQLAHDNNNKHLIRLANDCPVTEAEVIWSARHEHCEHVIDFIARRTRMAFVNSKQASEVIPRVA